jgi:hypothetical protein
MVIVTGAAVVGGTAVGGTVVGTFASGAVGAGVVAGVPPQAVKAIETITSYEIVIEINFLFILSSFFY